MSSRFQIQVPAKWILAGEHAVLRGATAVALPHPEMQLEIRFDPQGSCGGLKVSPQEGSQEILDLISAIRDRWESEDRVFPKLEGHLEVKSSIPIGAGLGSSAALCVAISRWLSEPLGISKKDLFEFAIQLEHRFHGRSSGLDIAVISAREPISFVANRGARPLGIRKIPRFTFHDTELRARTSECVIRVEKLREEDPALAMRLDEAMSAASRFALEGLVLYDSGSQTQGLEQVKRGMMQAQECFRSWQLVPGAAHRMERKLLAEGALAVKLTGAGGGGFLVALWVD